jgi:hypothetical protein
MFDTIPREQNSGRRVIEPLEPSLSEDLLTERPTLGIPRLCHNA